MTWEFDVVEFDADDGLEVGDAAPDLSRPLVGDDYWRDVSLSSLAANGSLLLLFHSMNGSWPAIFLWQELRDRGWHETEGVDIVGVTISTPYSCWEFREQWSVPYRLYSDPQNDLAEAFGVVHDLDGMDGITEPRMSAFHLDQDLEIQYRWVAQEWPEAHDYEEIRREVLE